MSDLSFDVQIILNRPFMKVIFLTTTTNIFFFLKCIYISFVGVGCFI